MYVVSNLLSRTYFIYLNFKLVFFVKKCQPAAIFSFLYLFSSGMVHWRLYGVYKIFHIVLTKWTAAAIYDA